MNYKFLKLSLIFLATLCKPLFAIGSEKPCDTRDWHCHGSLYLTGGYVFANISNNTNPLTFTPSGQPPIPFTPHNNFPHSLSGMRLGAGWGLGNSSPFYFETDYTQLLSRSKTEGVLDISRAIKTLVGTVGYALNPKDRLRVSIYGGAAVISGYTTIKTIFPRPYASEMRNAVDVDPLLGGSLVYQMNARFAFRLSEFFDFTTYNQNARGALVTLVMLNYYPQ